jgi:hypothetical protein
MQFGEIADPPAGVTGGPTQREARAVKPALPCRNEWGRNCQGSVPTWIQRIPGNLR